MMAMNFSFNNPPLDNIAFLMSKKPQVDFDRSDIYQAAHQRAFTVARIASIDLLADIQASLENAFVEGQTYSEWAKELRPTLEKSGWFGKSVEVINPKTKEKQLIEVGATRLKKIFYTNARTAYHQSRARVQYESDDEYLRYVAIAGIENPQVYVVVRKYDNTYRLALGKENKKVRVSSLLINENVLNEMRNNPNGDKVEMRLGKEKPECPQPSQLKRLKIQQKFELEWGQNQKRILRGHKSPNESENELPLTRDIFKSF